MLDPTQVYLLGARDKTASNSNVLILNFSPWGMPLASIDAIFPNRSPLRLRRRLFGSRGGGTFRPSFFLLKKMGKKEKEGGGREEKEERSVGGRPAPKRGATRAGAA